MVVAITETLLITEERGGMEMAMGMVEAEAEAEAMEEAVAVTGPVLTFLEVALGVVVVETRASPSLMSAFAGVLFPASPAPIFIMLMYSYTNKT